MILTIPYKEDYCKALTIDTPRTIYTLWFNFDIYIYIIQDVHHYPTLICEEIDQRFIRYVGEGIIIMDIQHTNHSDLTFLEGEILKVYKK